VAWPQVTTIRIPVHIAEREQKMAGGARALDQLGRVPTSKEVAKPGKLTLNRSRGATGARAVTSLDKRSAPKTRAVRRLVPATGDARGGALPAFRRRRCAGGGRAAGRGGLVAPYGLNGDSDPNPRCIAASWESLASASAKIEAEALELLAVPAELRRVSDGPRIDELVAPRRQSSVDPEARALRAETWTIQRRRARGRARGRPAATFRGRVRVATGIGLPAVPSRSHAVRMPVAKSMSSGRCSRCVGPVVVA